MILISNDQQVPLQFYVNGQKYNLSITTDMRLVDVLRDKLGLIGVKEGCGVGECGACTVLLNGKAVNSCMMLAIRAQDAQIETIEGLSGIHGQIHPLQKSFIENNAVGCGFCTPGTILSAKALLDTNAHPATEEIREAVSGNLCRCIGYHPVVEAIRAVVDSSLDEGD